MPSDTILAATHPTPTPTHPGIRATLRALVGRLGAPDLALSSPLMGLAALPVGTFEPGVGDWDQGPAAFPEAEEPSCRRRAEKARLRRANAHAAYDSVEGTHAAALDAAIAVIEAEYAALERRCAAQTEALKQLQIYGIDAATRKLATKGLNCDAEFLADHSVVERAPAPGTGTFHA